MHLNYNLYHQQTKCDFPHNFIKKNIKLPLESDHECEHEVYKLTAITLKGIYISIYLFYIKLFLSNILVYNFFRSL